MRLAAARPLPVVLAILFVLLPAGAYAYLTNFAEVGYWRQTGPDVTDVATVSRIEFSGDCFETGLSAGFHIAPVVEAAAPAESGSDPFKCMAWGSSWAALVGPPVGLLGYVAP